MNMILEKYKINITVYFATNIVKLTDLQDGGEVVMFTKIFKSDDGKWEGFNPHDVKITFVHNICDVLDKFYQEWLFEVEMEKALSIVDR